MKNGLDFKLLSHQAALQTGQEEAGFFCRISSAHFKQKFAAKHSAQVTGSLISVLQKLQRNSDGRDLYSKTWFICTWLR